MLDYCTAVSNVDVTVLTTTTSPINILQAGGTDIVDCTAVASNGGQTTNLNIGFLPGNTPPSTCTMPGPIAFIIPSGVTARSGGRARQKPVAAAPEAPPQSPGGLREIESPWSVVEPAPRKNPGKQNGDQGLTGAKPPQNPDHMPGDQGFTRPAPQNPGGSPGDQGLPGAATPLNPGAQLGPGEGAGFTGPQQPLNPGPGLEPQPPMVNRPWPGDGVWSPAGQNPSPGDNSQGGNIDQDMLQDVGADGLPGEQGAQQQQQLLQPGFSGGVGTENPVVWSPVVVPVPPSQQLKRPSRPTIG
jgi:hypothetical protein